MLKGRIHICAVQVYIFRVCIPLIVTCLPGIATAELWQFEPRVTLEGVYDDNIRLTSGAHESVTGALLRGNLGFKRKTEISQINGKLLLNLSDYSGNEVTTDNNSNLYLKFDSYTKTELSTLGLDGSYKRDTTSRLIDIDIDDDPVGDVDEGLVDIDVRRNELKLTPYFLHSFSERTSLSLSYDLIDVRYSNNPSGSGLFDYEQHGVSGTILRRMSERDVIFASLGASQFSSEDNNDIESDSYTFTVGYQRQFSELTKGEIVVGLRDSSISSNIGDIDESGFLMQAKLEHSTERDRFELRLNHDLQPSGSGELVETNKLTLRLRRNITERLGGVLNLRFTDSQSLQSSNRDRRHLQVKPSLSWRLDRWWTLSGGYKYRKKENNSGADSAESNSVFLSIMYSKPVIFE